MRLLLSQKNQLFEIIQNNGYFTPNSFELKEGGDHKFSTWVVFKKSAFQFSLTRSDDYQNTIYIHHWPGEAKFQDVYTVSDWYSCTMHFIHWLSYLQREVTAPNLWERFQNSMSDIKLSSESNNAKFTHVEYLDLTDKMNKLIDAIPNLKLLENQTKTIQSELHNLLDKATELGKFDWKNLFIGTIISIVIQLNVNQENANALWNLIKGIFSNYFLT